MRADRDHAREIEAARSGPVPDRPAVVVESWRRCLDTHGLDPARRGEAYILPARELRRHRQESEELISIARSGIESLYRLVAGQDYVLLLADRQGVTVEYLGREAAKADLRRAGLWMGAEWSESRAGTCAVGACIESGEALVIHQSDHFDVAHTGLSCTAAPVYDAAGRLAAVLDVSLLSSPRPRESQGLALGLVRQTARRIEMANLMARARRDWVLRLARSPEFLDVDPEAAVSLDAAGRVIGMTHNAARLLARAGGGDWRAPETLLGRGIAEFFDLDAGGLEALTRGAAATRDRGLRTCDGRMLYGHAIEPRPAAPRILSVAPSAPARLPAPLRVLAGEDPAMQALLARAAALAPSQAPLAIEGESGSGRKTLARAIHAAARRGPCVLLPCAELGDADEGAVFGHGEGRGPRAGLVDEAAGGTLIVDRIAEAPTRIQARLARLLAEGAVRAPGAARSRRVAVRLIATAADWDGALASGALRPELGRRFAAPLRLPPLRARRDALGLIEAALQRATGGRPDMAAAALLARHPWPGNFHALLGLAAELAAERTASRERGAGRAITPGDLPPAFHDPAEAGGVAGEAALLARMIAEAGGNLSEVARRLGVDRSTVHRRMKRLGIAR